MIEIAQGVLSTGYVVLGVAILLSLYVVFGDN